MIENILWIISFFSLWLVLIWLQVLYLEEPKKLKGKNIPSVTIAVPVYNEESTITRTIDSLAKLNYPKEKLEIVVVNDGSDDGSVGVVKSLIGQYKGVNIILLSQKNNGKASAVNNALKHSSGELFAVVDADSRVEPNSLRLMVPHFEEEGMGAVISRIRVDKPKIMLERMQRFEYIMSNMIRNLMAKIGTLAITPGVLSLYNAEIIKGLGGFDENKDNLTEDFEIAMRLKYNGYKVAMEQHSVTHTMVPKEFRTLWRQRIRWARGFIYNHWKYKSMFLSREHGLFGIFQMPINILVLILLILNISIISFSVLNNTTEFMIRSLTIEGYFMNNLLNFPTIKEIFLGQNLRVMVPIILAFFLGLVLIIMTHKIFKEKLLRHVVPAVSYFLFVPYFMTLNWISSIAQELGKTKKKW